MEKYKDTQFGTVEVLYTHVDKILTEDNDAIGQSIEKFCKLPNGHYIIAQEKIFDAVPNLPMHSEYYVKKEWIELIVKNGL
jgi:hypothetical protein